MNKRDSIAALFNTTTLSGDGRSLLATVVIASLVIIVGLQFFGYGSTLPMLSGLLVAAGFAIAAIAFITGAKRHDVEVTSWDVAGVLTFVGFAAAMIAS
jgi:hypothetical protein